MEESQQQILKPNSLTGPVVSGSRLPLRGGFPDAIPSEAELIEMEKDFDWLERETSSEVEDDESIDTVTMSVIRAERIIENARRLIELARQGAGR